jgi:type IV secretory pathway TrbF-like protein
LLPTGGGLIRRPDLPRFQYTDQQLDLVTEARGRVADALLGGISPVVRRSVEQAMIAWENSRHDRTSHAMVNGWTRMAALLHQPGEVIERLLSQPMRRVV